MNLPSTNLSKRILQWNCRTDTPVQFTQGLLAECEIDQVGNKSEFVLKLAQRKHQLAIVLTSEPFSRELQELRQFMRTLNEAQPVALILEDCPFPVIGLEKEFAAIIHCEDSSEKTRIALAELLNRRNTFNSNVIVKRDSSDFTLSVQGCLRQANQHSIVSIVGEVGTAKSLFARMLHKKRGVDDKDCFTFYCGEQNVSVASTISELINQPGKQKNTFVLWNPDATLLQQVAPLFAENANDPHVKKGNQLVILQDEQNFNEGYTLKLIPLRERIGQIREMVASLLVGFSRLIPEVHISVSNSAIDHLVTQNWPGNIYQLNLTIVSTMLEKLSAMQTGELELNQNNLKNHQDVLTDKLSHQTQRVQLRNCLNAVCNTYKRMGGEPLRLRNMLNEILTQNPSLAWQIEPMIEQQSGIKDGSRRAA